MTEPRYSNVTVKLIGTDGNAFAILARVRQGLRAIKVPETTIKEFIDSATEGDYNHLLATCMEWVKVT